MKYQILDEFGAYPLTEDQIIEFTADSGLFTDDGNHVDYVEEISEAEYKLLKA